MKKRDKSASSSDSEFKKLPRRLQKLILRNYEEQETYEYDNLPGDNHYSYSFDIYWKPPRPSDQTDSSEAGRATFNVSNSRTIINPVDMPKLPLHKDNQLNNKCLLINV